MGSETFYAVMIGRKPGVYKTWAECEKQVKGFKNAQYKKFPTIKDAEAFVKLKDPATNFKPSEPEPKFQATRVNIFKQYNRESPCDTAVTTTTSTACLSSSSTGLKRERKASSSSSSPFSLSSSGGVERPNKVRKNSPYTVVYTDGASANNGKDHARAGYGIYWGENDSRNVSARLKGERQTNQRAEATAVLHVLEDTKDSEEPLEIRTDSQYVINAVTVWYKNWVKKDWIASNGREVQNRDLFEPIVKFMKNRKSDVKFTYVPGHSGVEGNERADQLAVAGAQMGK